MEKMKIKELYCTLSVMNALKKTDFFEHVDDNVFVISRAYLPDAYMTVSVSLVLEWLRSVHLIAVNIVGHGVHEQTDDGKERITDRYWAEVVEMKSNTRYFLSQMRISAVAMKEEFRWWHEAAEAGILHAIKLLPYAARTSSEASEGKGTTEAGG